MYKVMKDVANAFQIKCSKYKVAELTPEFRNVLFDEALNETLSMSDINGIGRDIYKNKAVG